jgi:hypothetical protein
MTIRHLFDLRDTVAVLAGRAWCTDPVGPTVTAARIDEVTCKACLLLYIEWHTQLVTRAQAVLEGKVDPPCRTCQQKRGTYPLCSECGWEVVRH